MEKGERRNQGATQSSNAPNVDKDNMLLNVSHNNDSDCNVEKNLEDRPDSFRGTNMVIEANVDNNNIQNESTKTESAID